LNKAAIFKYGGLARHLNLTYYYWFDVNRHFESVVIWRTNALFTIFE